jgi:hypothetical protein
MNSCYGSISRVNPILKYWVLLILALNSALGMASESEFIKQRRAFREEIENKQETPLFGTEKYYAVTFPGDAERWRFEINDLEREELKKLLGSYFEMDDLQKVEQMITLMQDGLFLVYKDEEYKGELLLFKTAFLIPPNPSYWPVLTDIDGIEKYFHVYNTSVALGENHVGQTYAFLQTEGSLYGFRHAINVIILYNEVEGPQFKRLEFKSPSVSEKEALMQILSKKGDASADQTIIHLFRKHPLFKEQDQKGEFMITDEDILEMFKNAARVLPSSGDRIAHPGCWEVREDFQKFYYVTFTIPTEADLAQVGIEVPQWIGGLVQRVVHAVACEVSAKYLPLSMKNFRDFVAR